MYRSTRFLNNVKESNRHVDGIFQNYRTSNTVFRVKFEDGELLGVVDGDLAQDPIPYISIFKNESPLEEFVYCSMFFQFGFEFQEGTWFMEVDHKNRVFLFNDKEELIMCSAYYLLANIGD